MKYSCLYSMFPREFLNNDEYKNVSSNKQDCERKDFDKIGWKASLSITYVDDKIVKVEYDEVNKDAKKKSEDTGYAKLMKDTTKTTPVEVFAKLTKTALKEDKVDVVTGATTTSNGFKELYEQAKTMKK